MQSIVNFLFSRRLFGICYCSGVLRGQPDEVPSTMQFKPSFEDGALLTVVTIQLLSN